MNSTAQTILTSAAQAAAALAPIDPKAAALVALAPVALQLLDTMTKMQGAGTMTADDIEKAFSAISKNVQSVHDEWAAMNAAAKA